MKYPSLALLVSLIPNFCSNLVIGFVILGKISQIIFINGVNKVVFPIFVVIHNHVGYIFSVNEEGTGLSSVV